jgi:hypothetical protein
MSISSINYGAYVTVKNQATSAPVQTASPQAPVDNDGDEIGEGSIQIMLENRAKAAAARGGVDIKV